MGRCDSEEGGHKHTHTKWKLNPPKIGYHNPPSAEGTGPAAAHSHLPSSRFIAPDESVTDSASATTPVHTAPEPGLAV